MLKYFFISELMYCPFFHLGLMAEMIFVYIFISEPMVWFWFFFHLGQMADDEIYNPNANVPLWVNIVIPIISVVIFVYIFI